MALAYSMFLGRFYLASKSFNVTHDAGEPNPDSDTITTTAGNYYIKGYTGESTNQLVEHLQAQIRASSLGTSLASATVDLNEGTGQITINFATGGTEIGITWTDTDLRDLLGFTGDLSGADSYTATNQCRYIWRPTRYVSNHDVDRDQIWAEESNSRVVVSSDATAFAITGNTRKNVNLEFRNLPAADVRTDSATVWETFQQFFVDVIAKGETVRYIPDRATYSSTSYGEGLAGPDSDSVGKLTDYISRALPRSDTLWGVSIDLVQYT